MAETNQNPNEIADVANNETTGDTETKATTSTTTNTNRASGRSAKRKMVKIKIPRTSPKQEDVFVSVNAYTCIVKRGVEVEVPDFVAEVLKHQEEMMEIATLYEQSVNK